MKERIITVRLRGGPCLIDDLSVLRRKYHRCRNWPDVIQAAVKDAADRERKRSSET